MKTLYTPSLLTRSLASLAALTVILQFTRLSTNRAQTSTDSTRLGAHGQSIPQSNGPMSGLCGGRLASY
ncbi:hypothetical protein [Spirosoma flavum]|uniref:Secreted protein n=1 Tax=Spirosoma flavum TaxID=2048557 RepID=A0ABW6AIZ5_9BACT